MCFQLSLPRLSRKAQVALFFLKLSFAELAFYLGGNVENAFIVATLKEDVGMLMEGWIYWNFLLQIGIKQMGAVMSPPYPQFPDNSPFPVIPSC